MLSFETINELTLKVTCTGSDVLFVKAGAFIAGDNCGPKNYRFERYFLVHSRVSDRLYLDSLPEESQEKTFR